MTAQIKKIQQAYLVAEDYNPDAFFQRKSQYIEKSSMDEVENNYEPEIDILLKQIQDNQETSPTLDTPRVSRKNIDDRLKAISQNSRNILLGVNESKKYRLRSDK